MGLSDGLHYSNSKNFPIGPHLLHHFRTASIRSDILALNYPGPDMVILRNFDEELQLRYTDYSDRLWRYGTAAQVAGRKV